MLPLRDFDGWLKQVRAEDLSALQRLALDCAFPSIAPPDAMTAGAAAEHLRSINAGHASAERIELMVPSVRVNQRRYAGDHTLGPRNYHTLARNAAGDDGSTLIAELAAYSDTSVGACSVHDGVSPDAARELEVEHRTQSLLLKFSGSPGSNAAIARLGTDAVWIPYRVEHSHIEGVIDLRQPDVQDWFCTEFADFHRTTMDSLEAGKKPDAVLPSMSRADAPTSFFSMLPVLMDPERGGNTVTDHIGQWLRLHGVNALIYPSARLAVGVAWDGTTMRRWMGWNLVDYRGRDRQVRTALTLILGANPWQSAHAERFDLQRRDASWVMVPPQARFSSRRPVLDVNLRARFSAGEPVFRGLINLAVQHQQISEGGWLESLAAACGTELGGRILSYMGIKAVRTLEADDGGIRALLLECWRHDDESSSLSKGFACIPDDSGELLHESLDAIVSSDDLRPGEPVFASIGDGMHIYLQHSPSA